VEYFKNFGNKNWWNFSSHFWMISSVFFGEVPKVHFSKPVTLKMIFFWPCSESDVTCSLLVIQVLVTRKVWNHLNSSSWKMINWQNWRIIQKWSHKNIDSINNLRIDGFTASGWKNEGMITMEIVHKIWQNEDGRNISRNRRQKCCGIQNPKFQLNCSLKPAGRSGDFQ
jgi:hypothetical protein